VRDGILLPPDTHLNRVSAKGRPPVAAVQTPGESGVSWTVPDLIRSATIPLLRLPRLRRFWAIGLAMFGAVVITIGVTYRSRRADKIG
jgi:hypothetical protein